MKNITTIKLKWVEIILYMKGLPPPKGYPALHCDKYERE